MTKLMLIRTISACVLTLCTITYSSGEPWKFGLMSDTQWKSNVDGENPNTVSVGIIKQINAEFIKHDVKMVLQVGDLVDVFSAAAFETRAQAAQDLLDAGIGFFPLRGNHESSTSAANSFSAAFPQACGDVNTFGATNFQSASMSLECLSYSFDYNNVRFVMLDQFTRKDNTGTNASNNILDQLEWVNTTLSSRAQNTHAFVLAHKNLIGQNHTDMLFGANQGTNTDAQNTFYKSLSDNGVRYYFGGHDHMHHRSIVTSPDGQYSVKQLIGASNSYKFYIPLNPSNDARYSNPARELPISQEMFTIGYYIFTVDGPRVTVEYYTSLNGCGGTLGAGVDCDLAVTPSLSFVKRETFGYSLNGKDFVVQPGDPLTVVSDTCKIIGSAKTRAAIISGTNSVSSKLYDGRTTVQNVLTGWTGRSEIDADLQSDILSLWGMANKIGSDESDLYTLSLSYSSDMTGSLVLVSKDKDANWTNASENNFNSSSKFVVGPYKSSFGIGTYGIDPATHTVWAVINHGGEFAVAKASNGKIAGDQDDDGDIDTDDVQIVTSLKNKSAEVKPSADLDNDGKITVLDARKLTLIRTK
jgi:hypothetical protein